ncbi:hypothetical protein B0H13DRAFT_1850238 [Mycena leptocephala]|nr:hypothetical protein B0H13DRAFT_1850238 [Mycena leptocephala]
MLPVPRPSTDRLLPDVAAAQTERGMARHFAISMKDACAIYGCEIASSQSAGCTPLPLSRRSNPQSRLSRPLLAVSSSTFQMQWTFWEWHVIQSHSSSNGTSASQLPPSAALQPKKKTETRFGTQDAQMKKDSKPSVITLKDFAPPVIKKKKLEVKTVEIYVDLNKK